MAKKGSGTATPSATTARRVLAARKSTNNSQNAIYGGVAALVIICSIWLAVTDSSVSSSSAPSTVTKGPTRVLSMGLTNLTCETPSMAAAARDARATRKGLPKVADANIAGCSPMGNNCGRWVEDDFITADECTLLRGLGESGWSLTGGGTGGASVLELQSGAVSQGSDFVDVYRLWNSLPDGLGIASPRGPSRQAVALYRNITQRIAARVRDVFGVSDDHLWLTTPAFMSRIDHRAAKTTHDEYWHDHIDRLQYGSFAYTSLLYLNDHGTDYTGGRFMFSDAAAGIVAGSPEAIAAGISTVQPRCGRLNLFTSGSENVHRVERVTRGTRYALTIAFTCDPAAAVKQLWPRLTDDAYEYAAAFATAATTDASEEPH